MGPWVPGHPRHARGLMAGPWHPNFGPRCLGTCRNPFTIAIARAASTIASYKMFAQSTIATMPSRHALQLHSCRIWRGNLVVRIAVLVFTAGTTIYCGLYYKMNSYSSRAIESQLGDLGT